ncbi:MAG TPA: HEAT repeat domain-containing protein [Candidatus Altiarchaeales archaeon]|nr:HEAT repeat domain-containing protein [Candidatus Altiarchaeales archaeon]
MRDKTRRPRQTPKEGARPEELGIAENIPLKDITSGKLEAQARALADEMGRVGVQVTLPQAKKAVEHGWAGKKERDFVNDVIATCGRALDIEIPTTFDDTKGGGTAEGEVNFTQVLASEFKRAPHVIGFHEAGHCIEHQNTGWTIEQFRAYEHYRGTYIMKGFEHQKYGMPPFSLTQYHQKNEGEFFGKEGLEYAIGYNARQIYCDSIGFKEVSIRQLKEEPPIRDTEGKPLTIGTLTSQYLGYLEDQYDNITKEGVLTGQVPKNLIPAIARFAASAWAMEYLAQEIPDTAQSEDKVKKLRDWSNRFLNLFGHPSLQRDEILEIRETPVAQQDERIKHLRKKFEESDSEKLPLSGLKPEEVNSIAILVRAYKRHFMACISRKELIQEDDLRPHFERLLDGNEGQKIREIHLMAELGDSRALPHLIPLLKDNSNRLREATIKALGNVGSDEAAKELAQLVQGGGYYRLAESSAINYHEQHSYWESTFSSIEALGEAGGDYAIRVLSQMAQEDSDETWRWLAIRALGKKGDKKALNPLVEISMKSGPDRFNAIEALTHIDSNMAAQFLKRILENPEEDIIDREKAIRSLGSIRDTKAVPLLVDAVENGKGEMKRFAAESLGRIGGEEAFNSLVKAMKTQHMDEATTALGEMGDANAIEPLTNALEDENWRVRASAASSLGKLEANQSVPLLIKALDDDNRLVRTSAAGALGKIGDPAALPYLWKLHNKSVNIPGINEMNEYGDAITEINKKERGRTK